MAAVLCFAMCKANVFTPLGHHIGLYALALIDPLGAIFWGTYNSWIALAWEQKIPSKKWKPISLGALQQYSYHVSCRLCAAASLPLAPPAFATQTLFQAKAIHSFPNWYRVLRGLSRAKARGLAWEGVRQPIVGYLNFDFTEICANHMMVAPFICLSWILSIRRKTQAIE